MSKAKERIAVSTGIGIVLQYRFPRHEFVREYSVNDMQILTAGADDFCMKRIVLVANESVNGASLLNAAQLDMNKEGMVEYMISCCGYFPAESPRFTCFVGMRKKGFPASGGGMMAPVFSNIVNEIMGNNKSY